MRSLLLCLLACLSLAASAQSVSDFETPVLPKPDTFYLNYGPVGTDRGFDNGLAHFPFFTDSFGTTAFWRSGFSYSNVQDSLSGGQGNMFASRAGAGYGGSSQYAVAEFSGAYNDSVRIIMKPEANGKGALGFYATNSSYAYYSMKYGDGFARKFGDTTGTKSGLPQGGYPDFLRLEIQAWSGGALKPPTVEFYLADYRDADSNKDYILADWQWVDLSNLGAADSFTLRIQCSDTASYGGPVAYLNSPAFFCMDNFTAVENAASVHSPKSWNAKVYPNPAQQTLFVELPAGEAAQLSISDMKGSLLRSLKSYGGRSSFELAGLPSGIYLLRIENTDGQQMTQRIIRQ
jgi:hypothetical protein